MKHIKYYLLSSLLLVVSCGGINVNLEELTQHLETQFLEEELDYFSASMMRGNTRRIMKVSQGDTCYAVFKNATFGIERLTSNCFKKEEIIRLKSNLNSFDILSYERNQNYALFHTGLSDSSHSLLLNSAKRVFYSMDDYDSISMQKGKRLGYVLIQTNNLNKIPNWITNKFVIRKLRPGWYYYRSFLRSNSESF